MCFASKNWEEFRKNYYIWKQSLTHQSIWQVGAGAESFTQRGHG